MQTYLWPIVYIMQNIKKGIQFELNLGENKIKSEGEKKLGSVNLPVANCIYHAERNVGLSAIHCNCVPDQSLSNYHHNVIF